MLKHRLIFLRLNKFTQFYFTTLCCLCLLSGSVCADVYDNTWVLEIKGGLDRARNVAKRHGMELIDQVFKDYYVCSHHKISKRSLSPSWQHDELLSADKEILFFEQQIVKSRVKRDLQFNDAKWRSQWYLKRQNTNARLLDMNVMSAWSQGYTGRGVVVTILDDGIERTHPDLIDNYDSRASKDINGRDYDPTPRYEYTNENRHGTRCAGEVAASANNSICGVGVAFQAKIGGIRMLDGDVTDSVEALSLSYNRDHIDIYSVSWGPDDDGKTVDGPGSLARQAFRDGALSGRGGKGSIFIWASGNGGRKDNCNCDGYTNSIYTLSISSASENGKVPWYSEACSSTLATTYSSGDTHERQIITTDLREGCTDGHTGTSASAPLAAGIAALVLQANPSLTWRDMQYLVVMSSNPNNLQSEDWVVNGAGRRVSHHFGYGMMNAGKMVELAKNWTNVPPQKICEVEGQRKNQVVPSTETITIRLTTDGCEGTSNHVEFLEHVQARISLSSAWRGDLNIWLTSPMGTKSTLLSQRPNDYSKVGFNEWAFMSTHMWGESARGEWTLEIENGYRALESAKLFSWTLVLYGTEIDPLEVSWFYNRYGSNKVRNLKSRDRAVLHSPYLSSSIIKQLAVKGIIVPDINPANPKPTTPYYAPTFKPPTYKPANRPRFEYITEEVSGDTAASAGDNKVSDKKPIIYKHGDHHHWLGLWSSSHPQIRPSHTTSQPPGGAATLRDFTLVMHGTNVNPAPNLKLSAPGSALYSSRCPSTEVLYRSECVDACPHGWYSRFGVCLSCHITCASCQAPSNTSCTECYHGSVHVSGACIPIDEGITARKSPSLQSPGLSPHSLWWLMVGATITVCLLVAFLVVLAIYYAYLQGYICTAVKKRYASSNKNTQSTTFSLASSSTGQPSLTPTPEHIRLTVSQNSSQLELMSDSEISADEELAVRRGISVRV